MSSEYQYLPLVPREDGNSIRLLRLLPSADIASPVEGQLFEYLLPHTNTDIHMYEALSYVWGVPRGSHSIYVEKSALQVSDNLFAALLCLRNRHLERVIWIDAICINQESEIERAQQIRHMARIYGMARCVIVWLGEDVDGGALDTINRTAQSSVDKSVSPTGSNHVARAAILELMKRSWFRRVWVLQEAAAARQILIMHGRVQLDGYTFCIGLQQLDVQDEAFRDSQALIQSAVFLISQAAFRPRSPSWWTGRTSLGVNPLSELIDMYHSHDATLRHDRIYSLLGMITDDITGSNLAPDYSSPWESLFESVVRYLFRQCQSLEVSVTENMAFITTKGYAIGEVTSVSWDIPWGNTQLVTVVILHKFLSSTSESKKGKSVPNRVNVELTLTMSAKPVLKGDFICILEKNPTPIIVRAHNDYFEIIKLSIRLDDLNVIRVRGLKQIRTQKPWSRSEWLKAVELMQPASQDLALVWQWGPALTSYTLTDLNARHQIRDIQLPKVERLISVSHMMSICHDYEAGRERIQYAIDTCSGISGKDHLHTLICMETLATLEFIHGELETAEKLLSSIIQSRNRNQMPNSSHTFNSGTIWKDVAFSFSHGAERILLIIDILMGESKINIDHDFVKTVARTRDAGTMTFLLETYGHQISITEDIIIAAIENEDRDSLIPVLLKGPKGEVGFTQKTFEVAMSAMPERDGDLKKYGPRVKVELIRQIIEVMPETPQITEKMIYDAGQRTFDGESFAFMIDGGGFELMIQYRPADTGIDELIAKVAINRGDLKTFEMLFQQQGDVEPLKITENIVVAATGGENIEILYAIIDRIYDEDSVLEVTDDMLCAATGNSNGETLKYLLETRGKTVEIVDLMLERAAMNSNPAVMKLLLKYAKDKVIITDHLLEIAASYGAPEAMELLLGHRVHGDIEKLAICATRNQNNEVLDVVLESTFNILEITEEFLDALIASKTEGILWTFVQYVDNEVSLTLSERFIVSAMRDRCGHSMKDRILEDHSKSFPITEKALTAVATYQKALQALIDTRGDELVFTAKVWAAIILYPAQLTGLSYKERFREIELLLQDERFHVHSAEEVQQVFVAVAQSSSFADQLLNLLFDIYGDNIALSDEMIFHSATNFYHHREMLDLLIEHRKDDIKAGLVQSLRQYSEEHGIIPDRVMKRMLPQQWEARIKKTRDKKQEQMSYRYVSTGPRRKWRIANGDDY